MPQLKKSTAQHLLQGTEPQGKPEAPALPGGKPKMPAGISPDAKKIYKLLVKQLTARRAVTPGDLQILHLYAETHTQWVEARAKVAELGAVVEDTRLDNHGTAHTVLRKNPWQGIVETNATKMHAILRDLGLTPSAREKIKPTAPVPEPKPVQDDGFAERYWAEIDARNKARQNQTGALEDFEVPEIQ